MQFLTYTGSCLAKETLINLLYCQAHFACLPNRLSICLRVCFHQLLLQIHVLNVDVAKHTFQFFCLSIKVQLNTDFINVTRMGSLHKVSFETVIHKIVPWCSGVTSFITVFNLMQLYVTYLAKLFPATQLDFRTCLVCHAGGIQDYHNDKQV